MNVKADTVLIGLDAGGSYVKAMAVAPATGWNATASAAVPVEHPAPGHNERDANRLWDAAAGVLREVVNQLPPTSSIAAVGVTAHGNGAYLVDAEGRPTRPAIQASDTRASALVEGWSHAGVPDALRATVWNGLWPGQPGPLLAWLKRHEPDILARSHALLMCGDYLRGRLTGDLRGELTSWSCSGLLDSTQRKISEQALDAYDIADLRRLLPELVTSLTPVGQATDTAATATGLPSGTPVIAGAVDNVAMQLGAGVVDGSRILVGAGTWSINQLLVAESQMTLDGPLGRVAPYAACLAVPQGMALLIEASATSASTLAWALRRIARGISSAAAAAGQNVYSYAIEQTGDRLPNPDAPMFFPFLSGSRDAPDARGAWIGLSAAHEDVDLVRATLEGICLEHRRHVERLTRGSNDADAPLRLAGGAARSARWAQMFADVTARAVEVSPLEEIGALGAAAIAGTAVGSFTTVEAGASHLNPTFTRFEPDADARAEYDERYHRYRRWAAFVENEALTDQALHAGKGE